jgi:hypothetical protein
MTIKLDNIKEIKNVNDCVGLDFGTKVSFDGKTLIYAGITTHLPHGKIGHRMICDEEGNPVEYQLSEVGIVRKKVSIENPLYYSYKEILEAKN